MKYLLALLLAVAPPAFAAPSYVWVPVDETGAPGQSWTPSAASFFPNLEYVRQFSAGTLPGTNIDTTISLNTIMAAGSYRVWIAMTPLSTATNMMISIPSIGDTSVPAVEYKGIVITNIGTFTSGVAFSNLTLRITKLEPGGTSQTYYFSAIGILPLSYGPIEVFGGGLTETSFVDYTVPTTTNTDFQVGNLIPNGDFELGMAHGWCYGRVPWPGRTTWENNAISTNGGAGHGRNFVRMDNLQAIGGLFSPPIRVRAGVVGNYTLSFDARGDGATPMTVEWGAVFPGATLYFTNNPVSWTFTPTASWARYSTNFYFTPLPTRLFYVDFDQNFAAGSVDIDQVQLVEGTSTNYLANNLIEMGLTATGNRNGNMFNTNEPRVFSIQFQNNNSASTNIVFRYEAFDWQNHVVQSGSSNYTLPVGFTTTNLTLNTTNTGSSRIMSWVQEMASFRDELAFTVVPFPVSPTMASQTNSMFGIHGNFQTEIAASNRLWGIPVWNRSLSPGAFARWGTIEAVSNVFNWTVAASSGDPAIDTKVAAVTNDTIIYMSVNAFTTAAPAWGLTNGYPRLDKLSNYVYQVVDRYKDRVRYYNTANEPKHEGMFDNSSGTEYAPALEMEIGAIKAACPTCYVVAFELGEWNLDWATNVWNLLSAGAKANVDAVSVHFYPDTAADLNFTDEDEGGKSERMMAFGTFTGKPVWQTEGGFFNQGIRKGDVVGGKSFTANTYPSRPEEKFRRSMLGGEHQVRWITRALGNGFQRWFYYEARQTELTLRQADTQPSLWTPGYDSLTDVGSAFLWCKRFCDMPTNGVAALSNNQVRAYLFARTDERVLALYSQSRSNYNITTTNGFFEVLDLQGNRLATNSTSLKVGRSPVYWRSTVLTTNQMMATFNAASVVAGSDTIAPTVSIDVTSVGRVNNRVLPLQFRWTALDDWKVNTADYNTNVVTRYRFPNLTDWSGWSAERIATLASIPNETYLEVQASDLFGNQSASVIGPLFGNAYPPESATNRLNVIGTANIGTITVVAP